MIRRHRRIWGVLIVALAAAAVYVGWAFFSSVPDNTLWAADPFAGPGWHGIVPGRTSTEEALALLKASPFVRRASLSYNQTIYPDGTVLESIRWDNDRFNVIPGESKRYNEAAALDGTVRRVYIELNDERPVEDLIARLGEPDRVARRAETTAQGGLQTGIYLLYTGRGLAFRCVGLYSVEKGLLVPGSPVTHAYYFETPPTEEAVGAFPPIYYVNHPQETEAWPGYDPAP